MNLSPRTVYIVDGPAEVAAVEALGFIGSCNPFAGSERPLKQWRHDYEGCHVVVIPTNHTPGRERAVNVAEILLPVAKSLRVVELFGLAENGTIVDWLGAFAPGLGPQDQAECLHAIVDAEADLDDNGLAAIRAELRMPPGGTSAATGTDDDLSRTPSTDGPSGGLSGDGIPDFQWINKNLPIAQVAGELGLEMVSNGLIRCWHPDRHHNGDRTPSIGVRNSNNTVKCFGIACGIGPFGPIDLVKDVMGLESPAEAGLWIAARFTVPLLPKGKHLKDPTRLILRAGFEGAIGLLIQSGLWGRLSSPTRSIIPVLLHFANKNHGETTYRLTMSFRAIARYSGVKSPNSIAKAIRELQEIGWLARTTSRTGAVIQPANSFILTPESDEVNELANALASQQKEEIAAEREMRKRYRTERCRRSAQTTDQTPSAVVY